MNRVDRRRKEVKLKKFGINVNQYELMLKEQNGKCYICNLEDKSGALAVDHCHDTGNVRGLLCRSCNNGLGRFKDDVNLLERAIVYLNREYQLPEAPAFDEYIPHDKRPRWRFDVITPDGCFSSLQEAADFYNVHNTTIGSWCGVYSTNKYKKEGFKAIKVFKA